jgi:antirestriction protein ArdC
MGGKVKPGVKGTIVVFWKRIQIEEEDGEKKVIPFLRYYTVFNVEQCDGLEDKLPKKEEVRETTEEEKAEALSEATILAQTIVDCMPKKPDIKHGGGRACYSPSLDRVRMPEQKDFTGREEYYSVLFHELVHSTGHEDRLARKGVMGTDGSWSPFGSPSYAKEELVAEMGAAFLCGTVGIENKTIDNSAAYLQSWCDKLAEDPKLFVHAAAAAQRAADFILGRGNEAGKPSTDKPETTEGKGDQ